MLVLVTCSMLFVGFPVSLLSHHEQLEATTGSLTASRRYARRPLHKKPELQTDLSKVPRPTFGSSNSIVGRVPN